MNEDTEQARLAEAEAERIRREVDEASADPAAQEEWIRQSNLIYGGLAAAGLVVVQPFLTVSPLNLSAMHSSGFVSLEYDAKFRSRFRKTPDA
jgi:hypothetical protein